MQAECLVASGQFIEGFAAAGFHFAVKGKEFLTADAAA